MGEAWSLLKGAPLYIQIGVSAGAGMFAGMLIRSLFDLLT